MTVFFAEPMLSMEPSKIRCTVPTLGTCDFTCKGDEVWVKK